MGCSGGLEASAAGALLARGCCRRQSFWLGRWLLASPWLPDAPEPQGASSGHGKGGLCPPAVGLGTPERALRGWGPPRGLCGHCPSMGTPPPSPCPPPSSAAASPHPAWGRSMAAAAGPDPCALPRPQSPDPRARGGGGNRAVFPQAPQSRPPRLLPAASQRLWLTRDQKC